jgi:hypothetical protein
MGYTDRTPKDEQILRFYKSLPPVGNNGDPGVPSGSGKYDVNNSPGGITGRSGYSVYSGYSGVTMTVNGGDTTSRCNTSRSLREAAERGERLASAVAGTNQQYLQDYDDFDKQAGFVGIGS